MMLGNGFESVDGYSRALKRGGDRRHGNRNYTAKECSMERLEEMQWSVV